MKLIKLLGISLMTMLLCVGFAACSDDDQTAAESIAGYGEPIEVQFFKDYKNGEVVRKGSVGQYNDNQTPCSAGYLDEEGNARKTTSRNSTIIGSWHVSGNSIIINYTDGRTNATEEWIVEKLYLPYFVVRKNINSDEVDYRLISCLFDSDNWDDVEVPDEFQDNWP